MAAIKSEYEEFHGLVPVTNGSENWPKRRSARLLCGDAKIDHAFVKRAERHVRGIIKFLREVEEVDAYPSRKRNQVAV